MYDCLNDNKGMTYTTTQLTEILNSKLDPDNRVYNEGNGWECQGGYEDQVRGWLETQHQIREMLGITDPTFIDMYEQLTEYLDENS